jgi:hypothetical protein
MFNVDPVKDLERKIYSDMSQLKTDIIMNIKQYIDSRTQGAGMNPELILNEIQTKYMHHLKQSVISETQQSLITFIQDEIRKELCRITIERETYDQPEIEFDKNSDSMIRRETLIYEQKYSPPRDLHQQMIREETREHDDESHSDKENADPKSVSQDRFEPYQDYDDDSDVQDDLTPLSPPNKLPDSFVESRGSILPSEASSSKKETINLLDNSDNRGSEIINRSFQYHHHSDNSSMKKMKYNRNVSQKLLNTSVHQNLNESNILRERLTDPNNVSYMKSNDSITISHKTFNHSNNGSENITMKGLKGQGMNYIQSAIDLEKKRINAQKASASNSYPSVAKPAQVINSMNFGSPISMFNPDNKQYVPTLRSGEKVNHEHLSLEDLISKIDSKRDMIKRSVREEMEDYFGTKQLTPQFTDVSNSQLFQQSTYDQISYKNWNENQVNIESKGKNSVNNF